MERRSTGASSRLNNGIGCPTQHPMTHGWAAAMHRVRTIIRDITCTHRPCDHGHAPGRAAIHVPAPRSSLAPGFQDLQPMLSHKQLAIRYTSQLAKQYRWRGRAGGGGGGWGAGYITTHRECALLGRPGRYTLAPPGLDQLPARSVQVIARVSRCIVGKI